MLHGFPRSEADRGSCAFCAGGKANRNFRGDHLVLAAVEEGPVIIGMSTAAESHALGEYRRLRDGMPLELAGICISRLAAVYFAYLENY